MKRVMDLFIFFPQKNDFWVTDLWNLNVIILFYQKKAFIGFIFIISFLSKALCLNTFVLISKSL